MPWPALARENVNYWYVKDLQQEIVVNKDSSLEITEKITADTGSCPDCHGIYRVLSTRYQKTSTEAVQTPIELESITDFNGQLIKYTQTKNISQHTITWKIGDPNKTVKGINNYEIKYQVKNAIRFDNSQFDEFYWNLNGNFWDMEIDSFQSRIIFPEEVKKNNSTVDYYTGQFGSKDKTLANYTWIDNNTLEFISTGTLKIGEGITASVTFPKNIFTHFVPGFWGKFGGYFSFLIPILTLLICFWLWAKYGRDPKIRGPVVPEFEIPEKFMPMELGVVMTNGKLRQNHISAGIINLAVKDKIKIAQIKTKGFLGSSEDYQLTKVDKNAKDLVLSEELLLDKLFGGKKEIKLSDLKNKFYVEIPDLEKAAVKIPEEKNLVKSSGTCSQIVFIVLAIIFFVTAIFGFVFSALLGANLIISSILLVIFAIIIPRRTVEAVQFLKKIDGFKLYMTTAEKYRQRFNEKENIFEKFLPYAILFGITGLWIEKMKQIYGEDYFNTYHPVWFAGAAITSFNAESFSTAISSMSSHMSSTISSSPSSSGAGGGGFSGGGGGGGGGGGW